MTNKNDNTQTSSFLFDPWQPVPRRRRNGYVYSPDFVELEKRPEPQRADDEAQNREPEPTESMPDRKD